MSFNDDIKPQINSIASNLHLNLNIKTEEHLSPPKTEPFAKEVDTNRRLKLTPSKLFVNKGNESPNHLLSSKRLSDDSEESIDRPNKELSPLFKRIKKENNSCLLFDSKQFIKQELDTELDFNTRLPFNNLFSRLSLDTSGIPGPESSNCHLLTTTSEPTEGNELSEVLKQLNICHKTNQNCEQNASTINNSKTKKKKNKKSKKSREKKLKVTKNVFKTVHNSKTKVKSMSLINKKEQKDRYLFKIQSNIIKELKVSATGGLTADEVHSLMALRNEGIVRKNRKHCLLFKCLLCTQRFNDFKSAEEHIKSDCHLRNKLEQRFSRIDSILALDCGQSNDIEVIISRRRTLSQMSNKTKELLHSKGIRVKDGFGSNAFVCIDCQNETFGSLEAVYDHINTKSRLIDGLNLMKLESGLNICDISPIQDTEKNQMKKQFADLSLDQLNLLFHSEGIIRKVQKKSRIKRMKYYCNYCQKYRMTDYDMFVHININEHSLAKTKADLNNQMVVSFDQQIS